MKVLFQMLVGFVVAAVVYSALTELGGGAPSALTVEQGVKAELNQELRAEGAGWPVQSVVCALRQDRGDGSCAITADDGSEYEARVAFDDDGSYTWVCRACR